MGFKLGEFDAGKLQATNDSWVETADSLGLPVLEYEKTLGWIASHINYGIKNGDSYAYGIFDADEKDAVAVVDIIHTSRVGKDVGWLKMLEVTLGPKFAPSQAHSPELLSQILEVYYEAIVGTVQLSGTLPARVVKLFGRDDDLMKLFVGLNYHLNSAQDTGFSSKMEGRWLVISVN